MPPVKTVRHDQIHPDEVVGTAYVHPYPLGHVTLQPLPLLDEKREQVLREIVEGVLRDIPQDFLIDHVYAGIHQVGARLLPLRLILEFQDPAVPVDTDHSCLTRVVDLG